MTDQLIPHLFRTEYRKITSVLCKRFGIRHIEIAEDIASETFLTATETWGLKGLPENPTAWLYTVAANKAKNFLQRDALFQNKIGPELSDAAYKSTNIDVDLSDRNIIDSQLQMMFAICQPSIPTEAQIGLCLRILCGFGIEEIADAFLTNKETINKRLFRAKEKLRLDNLKIEMPAAAQIDERIETVLTTLYLLFNEGYYSATQKATLRKDLCLEAMRLCLMLIENPATNRPAADALLALMCFHASRFEARIDKNGGIILYEDQDTALWNPDLITQGEYYLNMAATGKKISRYHLEAAIAYWHTQKEDTKEKWESILQHYNQLLQIAYSPIAALNRTYALSKANSKAEAIVEAEKLRLTDNRFYFMLLGELYTGVDNQKAKEQFDQALKLAKTEADRNAILRKISILS
jgi:RNA polymerase sigma factor (sigma-70 family)